MEKTQINISNFPVELKNDLTEIAESEHRSFQSQVIHILKTFADNHPKFEFKRMFNNKEQG